MNVTMFSMMFSSWMYISCFKVGQPSKDCIRAYHRQFMSDYELWLDDNEDDLRIHCSENGCDYEPDFDFDDYCEEQYEHYLKGLDS